MTTEEFWNKLDAITRSGDKTGSLVEAGALLMQAYAEALPVLIACRRAAGRIQHMFTVFDEQNPDLQGNRYLICYSGRKQAELRPEPPAAASIAHAQSPNLEDSADDGDAGNGRRRRRAKSKDGAWMSVSPDEVAAVSIRLIIDNMNRKKAIGGLIFNLYDPKNSLAIPKFLLH